MNRAAQEARKSIEAIGEVVANDVEDFWRTLIVGAIYALLAIQEELRLTRVALKFPRQP